MRKWITATLVAVVAIMGISITAAAGTGTADSWSLELTFSTPNSTDRMPVKLGEGQSRDELLKPPPLPGMTIIESTDPADAYVNAYVVTTGARKAARSVVTADTDAPARVWAVDVETEDTGQPLSVTVKGDESFDKYETMIVDAENQKIYEISSDDYGAARQLGTAAASQRYYVVVGENQSFSVVSDGDMFGAARMTNDERIADVDVTLLDSTCTEITSTVTSEDGVFTLPGIASTGKHYVWLDGVRTVASECEIDISDTGVSTTACRDVAYGDFANDGNVNSRDLLQIRNTKNPDDPTGEANCWLASWTGDTHDCSRFDISGDSIVNSRDLLRIKAAWNKDEYRENKHNCCLDNGNNNCRQ